MASVSLGSNVQSEGVDHALAALMEARTQEKQVYENTIRLLRRELQTTKEIASRSNAELKRLRDDSHRVAKAFTSSKSFAALYEKFKDDEQIRDGDEDEPSPSKRRRIEITPFPV